MCFLESIYELWGVCIGDGGARAMCLGFASLVWRGGSLPYEDDRESKARREVKTD